jgi:hypothetical protein
MNTGVRVSDLERWRNGPELPAAHNVSTVVSGAVSCIKMFLFKSELLDTYGYAYH